MTHNGPSHGQHLLLTAREGACDLITALCQPGEPGVDGLQICFKLLLVLFAVSAHEQVLIDGQFLEDPAAFGNLGHAQMDDLMTGSLGDILAVEGDRAGLLGDQTHHALHGGGLAGAVGTDQRHDLALVDLKADALQRADNAIVDFKILNFQHCHRVNLRCML